MRIYSNIQLSWPQLLQVYTLSRIYPGQWYHYNFYKVLNTKPIQLLTYSPINLLQENRQYYCYDKLIANKKLEHSGNTSELIKFKNSVDIKQIYYPTTILPNDIMVIHEYNTFMNIMYSQHTTLY